jgi:hypothetical protein
MLGRGAINATKLTAAFISVKLLRMSGRPWTKLISGIKPLRVCQAAEIDEVAGLLIFLLVEAEAA